MFAENIRTAIYAGNDKEERHGGNAVEDGREDQRLDRIDADKIQARPTRVETMMMP